MGSSIDVTPDTGGETRHMTYTFVKIRPWMRAKRDIQRCPMLFTLGGQLPKLPLLDLHPANTWFLGPIRLSSKRHLDRFSRFRRAHERDQKAHRQTARPNTPFVATGHIAIAAFNVPWKDIWRA